MRDGVDQTVARKRSSIVQQSAASRTHASAAAMNILSHSHGLALGVAWDSELPNHDVDRRTARRQEVHRLVALLHVRHKRRHGLCHLWTPPGAAPAMCKPRQCWHRAPHSLWVAREVIFGDKESPEKESRHCCAPVPEAQGRWHPSKPKQRLQAPLPALPALPLASQLRGGALRLRRRPTEWTDRTQGLQLHSSVCVYSEKVV